MGKVTGWFSRVFIFSSPSKLVLDTDSISVFEYKFLVVQE